MALRAIESVRPEVTFTHLSLFTSLPSLRGYRERAAASRIYEGGIGFGKKPRLQLNDQARSNRRSKLDGAVVFSMPFP